MTAALRGVVVETADGSSDDERTVLIDEFDVDAAVRREWSSAAAFASDAPPKTRAVRAGTSPARARVEPAIIARLATLAEAFGASPVARDDERVTRDDDDDDDDDRWASPAASFMDDLCGCEQSEPTESSFREVRDRALEEATRERRRRSTTAKNENASTRTSRRGRGRGRGRTRVHRDGLRPASRGGGGVRGR